MTSEYLLPPGDGQTCKPGQPPTLPTRHTEAKRCSWPGGLVIMTRIGLCMLESVPGSGLKMKTCAAIRLCGSAAPPTRPLVFKIIGFRGRHTQLCQALISTCLDMFDSQALGLWALCKGKGSLRAAARLSI